MIGMDSYLNAYVDRRMKYILDEWDLSTRSDLSAFTGRLEALEKEIPAVKATEEKALHKLAELENRAERLKRRA